MGQVEADLAAEHARACRRRCGRPRSTPVCHHVGQQGQIGLFARGGKASVWDQGVRAFMEARSLRRISAEPPRQTTYPLRIRRTQASSSTR